VKELVSDEFPQVPELEGACWGWSRACGREARLKTWDEWTAVSAEADGVRV
jgi:hypothetical protein